MTSLSVEGGGQAWGGEMLPYGMPFVTKLEIAYGHHVSKLRCEKKKRKEELYSLALALFLTLTVTLYHLPTSYSGGPVHYTF